MVLGEHLPRPEIRTPDLTDLRPKVLSIRPLSWLEKSEHLLVWDLQGYSIKIVNH